MSDGERAGQPLGESGMKSVNIFDQAGGGVPATNASAVEVVQRSGMFGKLLSIEREQVSGVQLSMKSHATFRSSVSRMSSSFWATSDGGMEDMGTSPPQHASWPAIAAIMVSEVCGIGVLTLSQKYADLGWIPATLSILGMFGLLVFTSNLMVEVKKVFPAIVTMADAADYTFGRYVYFFTEFILAVFLVFGKSVSPSSPPYLILSMLTALYLLHFSSFSCAALGDFVLLVGKTLGSALFSVHMCSPLWTLIGAAALLPIIQLRTLNSTTVLCVINMISIMVAIALVIAGLVTQGRGPEVESPLVAEDLTFLGFMQSLSAIFFAFGGQFMFYELMSEMKDFTDFPKTFSIMGPFQVSIYLVVGCVGYYFQGTEASGYFLDNLGELGLETLLVSHYLSLLFLSCADFACSQDSPSPSGLPRPCFASM